MFRVFGEVSLFWQIETWTFPNPVGTLVSPELLCSCSFPGFVESCLCIYYLVSSQRLKQASVQISGASVYSSLVLFLTWNYVFVQIKHIASFSPVLFSMNSSWLYGPEFWPVSSAPSLWCVKHFQVHLVCFPSLTDQILLIVQHLKTVISHVKFYSCFRR